MTTSDDIYSAAKKQIDALQTIDDSIDAQIAAIKTANPGVPLTPDQLNTMSALRNQQAAVLGALQELSYVTMSALDSASEIGNTASALADAVKELKSRAADIAHISS